MQIALDKRGEAVISGDAGPLAEAEEEIAKLHESKTAELQRHMAMSGGFGEPLWPGKKEPEW
jgi:hypothetical protein